MLNQKKTKTENLYENTKLAITTGHNWCTNYTWPKHATRLPLHYTVKTWCRSRSECNSLSLNSNQLLFIIMLQLYSWKKVATWLNIITHAIAFIKFSSDNTGHKNVNYLKNPIVSFIWQTFVMLLPESLFQHLLSLNTVIILSQAKFGLAALFKRTAAAEQFLVK